MRKFIRIQLALVYPICPHWCESLSSADFDYVWPALEPIDAKIAFDEALIETVLGNARAQYHRLLKRHESNPQCQQPKEKSLHIILYTQLSETEVDIINLYQSIDDKKSILRRAPSKKLKAIYGKYAKFIQINIEKYGSVWLDWIRKDNDDEYELLAKWIPQLLVQTPFKQIIINREQSDGQCKYNLQRPKIQIF